jgi:hypothetical protein
MVAGGAPKTELACNSPLEEKGVLHSDETIKLTKYLTRL